MAKHGIVRIDRATVRFIARLLVFSLPTLLIIATGYEFAPLMNVTHFLAFTLLQATGVPVVSSGSSGWKSLLLFFALIMATEAPLRRRLEGLALLPIIYGANVVRVWFMFFYVHIFGLGYYEIIHGTLWSWGMIVFTLALWLSWRHWMEKYAKASNNMGYALAKRRV